MHRYRSVAVLAQDGSPLGSMGRWPWPALLLLPCTSARVPETSASVFTVDPSVRGTPSSLLVGAGIEDVNNELYGGVDSQMVFGDHFEEPGSRGISGAAFAAPLASGGRARPTWVRWSRGGRFALSQEYMYRDRDRDRYRYRYMYMCMYVYIYIYIQIYV